MFTTDSLFSIEFIVERLRILQDVVCRFPAVAFRLLDFPTVTLHMIGESSREKLHTKLTADPYYQIPAQIRDYQDREGFYVINSGKSCLYRIPPDTLRAHLAKVPLYVIIADDFTSSPTLVGSAVLSLDSLINSVYESLMENGVSVPTSNGIRCSLRIYNLMGHEIGQVVVGCRLISLGMALLSHLPTDAISTIPTESSPAKVMDEEKHVRKILTDMGNRQTDEDFPLIHVDKPDKADREKYSEMDRVEVAENFSQGKHLKKGAHLKDEEKDDANDISLIIPDIFCPPPMYYNKQAQNQPKVLNSGSTATSRSSQISDISDISDKSALSDVNEEERSVTDKIEIVDELKKSAAVQTQALHVDPILTVKPSNENVHLQDFIAANSSRGFPILQALMSELMAIAPDIGHSQPFHRSTPPKRPRPSRADDRVRHTPSPVLRSPSRVSSGRPTIATSSPSMSRHNSRTSLTKKAPLVYGTTNTQKLRLSKTNPELLKQIEEREAEQRKLKELAAKERLGELPHQSSTDSPPSIKKQSLKLKFKKRKHAQAQHSFRSYTSGPNLDVSTEMGRLQKELEEARRQLAETKRVQITPHPPSQPMSVTRVLTPRGRVISPMPSNTPRRSMSARNSRDGDLPTLMEQPTHSSADLTQTGFSSRKSLEIHLPTTSLLVDDDMTNDTTRSISLASNDKRSISLSRTSSYRNVTSVSDAAKDNASASPTPTYGSGSFESLSG